MEFPSLSDNDLTSLLFKHEFTAIVAGPSKSGKTEFVKKLIQWRNILIDIPPEKIVWVYREWQPAYKFLQTTFGDTIQFIYNMPVDDDDLIHDTSVPHLLVFDDLMGSKATEKIQEWFTRKGHHRNTSIIYMVQNLFDRNDKYMRTITLNAHYLILFKNPRDRSQVDVLSRQLSSPLLKYAYEDATYPPYGYLVIDLNPRTSELFRFRTDIFHDTSTGGTVLYVPRQQTV
jgi:hypothetical protein